MRDTETLIFYSDTQGRYNRLNRNGTYDIIIYDIEPFKHRVKGIKVYGGLYNVYLGGDMIVSGNQSGDNMFRSPVIPLDLLIDYKVILVIPNISKVDIEITLEIEYTNEKLPHENSRIGFSIPWGPADDNNAMYFMSGRAALRKLHAAAPERPEYYISMGECIVTQGDEYSQCEAIRAVELCNKPAVVQCKVMEGMDNDIIFDNPDVIQVLSDGVSINGHGVARGQYYNSLYAVDVNRHVEHYIQGQAPILYNKIYFNVDDRLSIYVTKQLTFDNYNEVFQSRAVYENNKNMVKAQQPLNDNWLAGDKNY